MKAFLARHPRARHWLAAAGLLGLFLAPGYWLVEPIVSAAAQALPSLFLASPSGAELLDVVTGGPQKVTVRLTQMRDAQGYSKQVPTAGATILYPNNISRLILIPAGTLATLTVTLPSAPFDGQEACLFSTQTLTALTMNAAAGQTLNGALTSLSANTTAPCWAYSLANTTWDRSQ